MNLYPLFYNPFFTPFIPPTYDMPPTLYSILNSIVNYNTLDKKKIKDLAKYGRTEIFDFEYELTPNISKEKFECMILNHFLMRRIGYETVTAFKIALNVKLDEILPKYNMLFNSIKNWDLFKDGQIIEKSGKNDTDREMQSNAITSSEINSEDHATNKNKHSDLPQNELQNIDDSKYINIYENNVSDSNTSSTNEGSAENNSKDSSKNIYNETIKYTQSDLINLYTRFQNEVNSVYNMIFKDLDVLFYGLV